MVDLYGDRPDVSKDAALNCINNIMAQFLAGSQAPFVEDEEIYKCKGLVQFVASVFEPFAVTLRDFATAVTILARETEQVGPRNVLVATVGRSPWWCLQSVPGI